MQEVAGVNISAVVQQISGDLNRRSKMEWGLSALATRMNQVGVGAYELLDLFEHAQACGGMRIQDGAALDQEPGQIGVAFIECTSTSRPGLTSCVDVSTRVEQHLDGFPVGALDGSKQNWEVAVVKRLIQMLSQFAVGS